MGSKLLSGLVSSFSVIIGDREHLVSDVRSQGFDYTRQLNELILVEVRLQVLLEYVFEALQLEGVEGDELSSW
jgi:hypothetical protein